jgi:hypothetical protein
MRFLLVLLVLVGVAGCVVYEGTELFLRYSGVVVPLIDPAKRAELNSIVPPLLTLVGTVTTALVAGGVALINWLAQRDLAAVQRKYLHDLEEKKAALSGELEAKKSALSVELEREKAQLDVLKSEVSRNLALFQRAIDVIGKYANSVRVLRRGVFDLDRIEECEMEMRTLLIEFDRDKETFVTIQKFLTQGIFVKERAERRSSAQGFKELWVEMEDGHRISTTFARLEDEALIAIRKAREECLADNVLTTV